MSGVTRLLRALSRPGDVALAVSCSALFVGLLLLHSLLAPPFRGPDEPHHFDLVREWSNDHDYDVVSRQISDQVIAALPLVDYYGRSKHLLHSTAPARGDRPRFDQLGPDTPSEAYNQISQHGPLYSVVFGTALEVTDRVEPGPRWSFDREVGTVRLLTIGVLAPVPALVLFAARRLGAGRPAALVAALVPSLSPQFTHIGALVSNDNLLTALAAVEVLLLARLLGPGARRWWEDAAVGFVAGLLLLTKAFAIAVCLAVALAWAIRWWRTRPGWRRSTAEAATIAGAAFVGGGWWYAWALLAHGSVQVRGEPLLQRAPPGFDPDPGRWFATFRELLPLRAFGDFGWFDVRIGPGWVGTALVLIAVGIVASLVGRRGGDGMPRSHVAVLLVPVLVTLAITAANSWRGYVVTAAFPAIQGRYLFIGVPSLAIVLGAGWVRLAGRRAAVVPPLVLLAVLAFQAEGVTTMLGYYWGPPDGTLRDQLAAMVAWSPWPKAVTLAFLVLPLLGAAAVLLQLLQLARQRPEQPPAGAVTAPSPSR